MVLFYYFGAEKVNQNEKTAELRILYAKCAFLRHLSGGGNFNNLKNAADAARALIARENKTITA